jgi:hypothetical protein
VARDTNNFSITGNKKGWAIVFPGFIFIIALTEQLLRYANKDFYFWAQTVACDVLGSLIIYAAILWRIRKADKIKL